MKLRTIVLVLTALAFLSLLIGGGFVFFFIKGSLEEEARQHAIALKNESARKVDAFIAARQRAVKTLASIDSIRAAPVGDEEGGRGQANRVLDDFQAALGTGVCYLLDTEGNTIASSNRSDPDSFIHHNYAFRPYFTEAMNGRSTVYPALGVTSQRRGIFLSEPVFDRARRAPVGVAVIKADAETLEEQFDSDQRAVILVSNSKGLVFLSNRHDWLYRLLRECPADQAADLVESMQFGRGPWEVLGLRWPAKDVAVDGSGRRYQVHETEIASIPGWKLMLLYDLSSISRRLQSSLGQAFGMASPILGLLLFPAVLSLHRKAAQEIARRRKAEREAAENLSLLQAALDSTTEGLLVVDRNGGRIVTYNRRFLEMWGLPEEVVSPPETERFFTFIKGRVSDPEDLLGRAEAICKDSERESFDVLRLKDGRVFELHSRVQRISGETMGRVWSFRDVTERHRAHQALAESEERYRQVFETNQAVKLIIDPRDGRIVEANSAACRFYGYSRETLTGLKITDIDTAPPQAVFEAIRAIETRERLHFHFRHRLASGELREVDVHSAPVSTQRGPLLYSIIHDTTERRRSEEALRNSERRFRDLVENLPVGVMVHEPDSRVLFANQEAGRILGVNPLEIAGKRHDDPIWCFLREDGTALTTEDHPVRRVVLSQSPLRHLLMAVVQVNTWQSRWVLVDVIPFLNDEKELESIISIFFDVTELRRARRDRETINRISQLFLSCESLESLYGQLSALLARRFDASTATVERFDRSTDENGDASP